VDTRSKILTPAGVGQISCPLTLVIGYFDPLRAAHARELQQIRDRAPARRLMIAVLTHASEVLDIGARAELVAALRVVDYVVTVDHEDLDAFIERLRAAEVVRLERADQDRTRQLIADAQRSQNR
jgi:bifunctional ADP-heptose synthase (sugar kinase/adenylyltransferase)